MILPLCSALVGHIWSAGSNAGFPSIRDMDILEQVQQKATKMIKALKHLSHEVERVRNVQLGAGKAQGDLIHVCKYLIRGVKCDRKT